MGTPPWDQSSVEPWTTEFADSDTPTISLTERVIESTVLTIICIIALTGNLALWYIVCSNRALRTASNALILCLSAADILVSAVNMPVAIASIVIGDWYLSDAACIVFGFITMVTFVASVMSLGTISINRYYLICHPNRFHTLYTKKRTAFFILGTWILAVLLATPPLIGWGEYAFLPNQSVCFCDWRTSISYTFFMVGTCFGGPCAVMTFCYVNIVREIRASKRRIAVAQQRNSQRKKKDNEAPPSRVSEGESIKVHNGPDSNGASHKFSGRNNLQVNETRNSGSEVNPVNDIRNSEAENKTPLKDKSGLSSPGAGQPMSPRSRKAEKRRQEHIRLAMSFAVVILVFVICWLPFCITMFLNVFSKEPIPRIPDMITLLLGCANSLCNPIIYGVMNTRFRAGYKQLFLAPLRKLGIGCVKSQVTGNTIILNETLSKS